MYILLIDGEVGEASVRLTENKAKPRKQLWIRGAQLAASWLHDLREAPFKLSEPKGTTFMMMGLNQESAKVSLCSH